MSTAAALLFQEVPERKSPPPRLLFGTTILTSACLLFLVQPLISKLILPWFGGSAAVWLTSMMFFQTGLLGGYLYVHLITRLLTQRGQALLHAILVLGSIAVLPVLPNPMWQPNPGEDPTWKVLAVLATSVGLPYVLLSATSPLLQSWYTVASGGGLPYRYFALSNAGSMAALLLYPVAIEPFIRGHEQAWYWSAGYFFFALLCIGAASRAARFAFQSQEEDVDTPTAPATSSAEASFVLWIALAACASTLLLTVTNLLTQNIAPMPLLWVVPLSIYLLSFILSFESGRWYQRWLFLPLLAPALWWLASHNATIESQDVKTVFPLICGSLFVCCMACHGELSRLKPRAERLTAFYLSISVGGALGGVFVALIAPRVFPAVYEYPISCVACAVVVLLVLQRERGKWAKGWRGQLADSCWIVGVVGAAALVIYCAKSERDELQHSVAKVRNFYGALLVEDFNDDEPKTRQLSHGTITHGVQMTEANMRHVPTSYYGRDSGAGLTYQILEKQGPVKLGVVGLGAGTMAAYGRGGDAVRFYDLNPLVVQVARKYFTFLADCPAHLDIVLGDARLSLANEKSRQFDMLVIDAFAGDAVPVHLLTKQAFDIYWRHLKPNGVLAVHISNQYLNLGPIVALDAKMRSLPAWLVNNDSDDTEAVFASDYILVSKRPDFFSNPLFANRLKTIAIPEGLNPWTDDFTSLWPIVNIRALSRR